jgi:hypothetical protein
MNLVVSFSLILDWFVFLFGENICRNFLKTSKVVVATLLKNLFCPFGKSDGISSVGDKSWAVAINKRNINLVLNKGTCC